MPRKIVRVGDKILVKGKSRKVVYVAYRGIKPWYAVVVIKGKDVEVPIR